MHLLEIRDTSAITTLIESNDPTLKKFYDHIVSIRSTDKPERLNTAEINIENSATKFTQSQNEFLDRERLLIHYLNGTDTAIQLLDSMSWKKKSNLTKYQFIKYLNVKAKQSYNANKYLDAQIYISYAVYQIIESDWVDKFPETYLKLLQDQIYLWTIDSKNKNELKILRTKVIELSERYGFDEITDYIKTTEENLSRMDVIEKINDDRIPIADKENEISILLKDLELPTDDKLFQKILSLIDEREYKPCHFFDINDLQMIADIYAKNKNWKQSNSMIEKMKLYSKSCNTAEKFEIYFIIINAKISLLLSRFDDSGVQDYLDECVELLNEKNSITSEILSNLASEHYDHAQVQTAHQTIEIGRKYSTTNIKFKNQILKALYISKSQELKKDMIQNPSDDDPEIKKIEFEINKKISLTKEWRSTPKPEDKLYEDLYKLMLRKNKILSLISKSDLKNTSIPKPLDLPIDSLQTYLSKNNAQILEYLSYENNVYIIYISDEEFKIEQRDTTLYNSSIRNVQNIINYSSSNRKVYLNELQNVLVPFKGIDKSKKLIVLKDGEISKIPIEIFFPKSRIEYHYDLVKMLKWNKEYIDPDKITLYSYSDKSTFLSKKKKKWSDLQHGWSAIKNISSILDNKNPRIYSGYEMTFDNFKKISKSEGAHIVTHAVFNEDVENNSQLIFRSETGSDNYIDQLDLEYYINPPKFVFLDACATGRGKITIGEGTISLSRSFLKKGTSTIIKTLWPIDDETSGEFAVLYYKFWKAGNSASEALYLAKQELRNLYPQPYHWAPFVLEGNPNLYLSQN